MGLMNALLTSSAASSPSFMAVSVSLTPKHTMTCGRGAGRLRPTGVRGADGVGEQGSSNRVLTPYRVCVPIDDVSIVRVAVGTVVPLHHTPPLCTFMAFRRGEGRGGEDMRATQPAETTDGR
jgi:hypothetical protein